MDNPFTDIDWTKPNAELAVDLEIVTTGDYVGYTAWSKRLGPPDPESPYFVWAHAMTKADAIDEVVVCLYDRFAPDDIERVAA